MIDVTDNSPNCLHQPCRWCVLRSVARATPGPRSTSGAIWRLICLCLLLTVSSAPAQEDAVSREYPLKALFLYNFGSYIEWPDGTFADKQTPFVIGVLGTAPLDETLNQIAAQKKIGERRIVIEHYKTPAEIKNCQILFVPLSTPQQQQLKAIEVIENRPVLAVGESPNFAASGGDINFFVQENKIRFEVNVDSTKKQQLKVNSKLLAMAKIVGGNAPPKR
jgi:hypothetical protein